MVAKYRPYAIAVGNGTGGRETESFVHGVLKEANIKNVLCGFGERGRRVSLQRVGGGARGVSDLDLTIRGAISIGRRLQDPLAELVKIDPKAIGVGQYQHDVISIMLSEKLEEVVVSCVNHVGVELNTASAPLPRAFRYRRGDGKAYVSYRDQNGAFSSRKQLRRFPDWVRRLSSRRLDFCGYAAGKSRWMPPPYNPERYALVERMAKDLGIEVSELGRQRKRGGQDTAGDICVGRGRRTDIKGHRGRIEESRARDPRASFEIPAFRMM
jgi:uncharacterized protein